MFSDSDALACREGGGPCPLVRVEPSVDDVEQRSRSRCGVWRGGRDGGLHERSGLLPPSAAAPGSPAAPAAGNALAGRRSHSLVSDAADIPHE